MTSRCPKCGKNNYGDVKKCSFCGSPLTFIPGDETPTVTEEDIQEKMSKMKVERIRNPMLMGIGGIVGTIGIVLFFIIYIVMMFAVYSPTSVEPSYENGAWSYSVNGGEQMIFGEITRITLHEDTRWGEGGNHGYQDYAAYEINGDGADNRVTALNAEDVNREPDVWVYSDENLGEEGDLVLIKVESKPNDFGESRAVFTDFAPWGHRTIFSGWIWVMPGFVIFLTGLGLFLVGAIGKADRSMERLMQEDKELRQQQIMLREAARKQMQQKEQQRQWQEGGLSGEAPAQGQEALQTQEGTTPMPGYPSQAPTDQPQQEPQTQVAPQQQTQASQPQPQPVQQQVQPTAQQQPPAETQQSPDVQLPEN